MSNHTAHARIGFPRIRGDVPMKTDMERLNLEFSPHTRGCSAAGGRLPTAGPVFPAYAGMFRRSTRTDWLLRSFPRIRGDVPLRSRSASKSTAFSPHTRGCSSESLLAYWQAMVFPAYAGMFRCRWARRWCGSGFPRIRGDVPNFLPPGFLACKFSPHTRGCSSTLGLPPAERWVFPAYAGMFLGFRSGRGAPVGFPRIRGDVPVTPQHRLNTLPFSPHTRGCS